MAYDTLADKQLVEETITALNANGFKAESVATKAEALEKIKAMIPAGVSVMAGSSTTLNEIGFTDYLKEGKHGWNNLKEAILAETDSAKQGMLRKQSVISDWYLGSLHAVSKDGQIVIASASGSQLPHLVFTSQNLILVVSTQKITQSLDDSMTRLKEYVFPLEDARMKSVNMGGSVLAKILLLEKEPSFMGRNFHVIFVEEKLGF
jgi:hypothetical protein